MSTYCGLLAVRVQAKRRSRHSSYADSDLSNHTPEFLRRLFQGSSRRQTVVEGHLGFLCGKLTRDSSVNPSLSGLSVKFPKRSECQVITLGLGCSKPSPALRRCLTCIPTSVCSISIISCFSWPTSPARFSLSLFPLLTLFPDCATCLVRSVRSKFCGEAWHDC